MTTAPRRLDAAAMEKMLTSSDGIPWGIGT